MHDIRQSIKRLLWCNPFPKRGSSPPLAKPPNAFLPDAHAKAVKPSRHTETAGTADADNQTLHCISLSRPKNKGKADSQDEKITAKKRLDFLMWCRQRDLNSHSLRPLPPQDSVSTNSTTRALIFMLILFYCGMSLFLFSFAGATCCC